MIPKPLDNEAEKRDIGQPQTKEQAYCISLILISDFGN